MIKSPPMRPVVRSKVAKAMSSDVSRWTPYSGQLAKLTVDLVDLFLSISQDCTLYPFSGQELPTSNHVCVPCGVDQVCLPVQSPCNEFGNVRRMNIEKQSVSTGVLVKSREFRRAPYSLVAASVQEVRKGRSGKSQDADTDGSHKLDGSRFRIHFFVSWFVRVKRQINLGCRGNGRHGLATVSGTCGDHYLSRCSPGQLCSRIVR